MDPELIKDCVHCGFCLPACPTYLLWGEEMDSPRGRIHLMGQHVEGTPITPEMAGHFDACLGCMACVTACPSGVRYDLLIEQTRAEVEREHVRAPRDRVVRGLVFGLMPYPRRLRLLRLPIRLGRRLQPFLERVHPSLGAMAALAPPAPGRESRGVVRESRGAVQESGGAVRKSLVQRFSGLSGARREVLPTVVKARGRRRAVVGMLTGCVQGEFFPQVNAATARVLALEGCEVVIPRGQGCCGALSVHAGLPDQARRLARRTVRMFEKAGVDTVVVNAAGCGSSMKEYAELLGAAPGFRTVDLSEFLAELGPAAERHPLELTVGYHDACHLAHAQGVRAQPRSLLQGIPGLTLKELPESDVCCGSAGTYNIFQPEAARELGDRKAAGVASVDMDLLVSANPGCTMQIAAAMGRRGRPIRVAHTAEVLDASLRGVSL